MSVIVAVVVVAVATELASIVVVVVVDVLLVASGAEGMIKVLTSGPITELDLGLSLSSSVCYVRNLYSSTIVPSACFLFCVSTISAIKLL